MEAHDSGHKKSTAEARHNPKRYLKDQLFGDAKEIIILHRNHAYRLRETRNGKLILNL